MSSHCSPYNQNIYDKTKSCYTLAQLRLIAIKYNDAHAKNNKIKVYTTKKILIESLQSTLKVHESYWYTMKFMQDIDESFQTNFKDSFKPKKPYAWKKDDKTWLNTHNIYEVMTQYEEKHKTFKFLGVYPLDFSSKIDGVECVSPIMCNFDINAILKDGYTQCGVILNLDDHNEPGSHWVSMYIGLSNKLPNFGCFYIDSTALGAPNEVIQFMRKIKNQINNTFSKSISKTFKLRENKRQFQFKNTECGMFSMYFLIQFLNKFEFKTIINSNIDDDKAYKLRNKYYNPI